MREAAFSDVGDLGRPTRALALDSVQETSARLGLPAETALGVGDEFLVRLHDPTLDRTIEHRYQATPLGDDVDERRDRPGATQ